ncbi:PAN domain-containing protein At5g03700-like [Coffea arabica]|uniref:PAN domain-containing protein At5g03700-like n=1 Tax=Coffea arabica TaxID=13443 RepID=A0A6P6SUE6_COFAR|nr:PAN domain-containing protein At5g03700-like [Coffea arabica]
MNMTQRLRLRLLTLLYVISCTILSTWSVVRASTSQDQLTSGFKATPNPAVSTFQPILTDSTGNYSLGFLRLNKTQLTLAVVHVLSSETIWHANITRLPRWSDPTQLTFNGSLVVSDPGSGVFWSTYTDGDRVWLSNTSNLQVETSDGSALWQSFDFPTDTLVENQNFTSNMSLVSSNGIYSMRLGQDFMGLYAKFKSGSDPGQIYLKHRAMQAKAEIVQGQPIYAVVESDGFLGMYQNGTTPVDVQSFSSYQQPVSGVRRVRMETDGNLKGYFWTGSSWILDYQAVSDPCELPCSCGPYGLCQPGKGCGCLNNNETEPQTGRCVSPGNHNLVDFCSAYDNKYKALRSSGVDLPYKELMGYQIMENFQECENACERNCTCWGAVYRNTSGFCYILDYPIQTLVRVADESKMGYFKVSEGVGKGKMDVGLGVGVGVLCGAILVIGGGLVGYGWYRLRRSKQRGVSGYVKEEGIIGGGVGPYKDLGAASFRSVELSAR